MRVLIGIPTSEIARFVDFYGYLDKLIKPVDTITFRPQSTSVAKNRNAIVREAIENGCSHIFFIDDDMCFPSFTLMRLLGHNKVIASGLICKRTLPLEIISRSLACTLIHTEVFKSTDEPWFRIGQIHPDELMEDIDFFDRVGLDVFVDTALSIGHHFNGIIWANGRITVGNQLYGVKHANIRSSD